MKRFIFKKKGFLDGVEKVLFLEKKFLFGIKKGLIFVVKLRKSFC